jgi:hypothetical protein
LQQVIGISSLKGKCNSKEREKEFSKLLSGKRRVHFSAKKCRVNVQKFMPKRKRRRKSNYAKVMPIIYIKGSFMKHPLQSDKQDGYSVFIGVKRAGPFDHSCCIYHPFIY